MNCRDWIACRLELRFLPCEQNSIAVANGTDGVRLDAFRVGRDCRKCARHLQQGDFARAERQARHRRQVGLHAELACGVDDRRNANGIGNLNRHGVERVRKGATQRDWTAEAPAVILRLPIADLHRPIDRHCLRIEALLEGGKVDKDLEQRAGLPLCLDGAIELAFVVVASTHHREDGAVRCHGDEGSLTDFLGSPFRLEPARDHAFGDALQIEIEGRAHGQVRGCRGVDEVLDVTTEHIDEIICARRIIGRHPQADGLSARGLRLLAGDRAGLDHRLEHQRRPLPRFLEMARGSKRGRRARGPRASPPR